MKKLIYFIMPLFLFLIYIISIWVKPINSMIYLENVNTSELMNYRIENSDDIVKFEEISSRFPGNISRSGGGLVWGSDANIRASYGYHGGSKFSLNSNYYRLPINLIPSKDVVEQIGSISTSYGGDIAFSIRLILRNVLGNLILLTPLGVISPILWKQISSIKMVIKQGFIVSVCIELLQLIEILTRIVSARAVDIDDVILNVLGIVIGYLIYRIIYYLSNRYSINFMTNILDS